MQSAGARFTDQLLADDDGAWFINYLHDRFTGGSFSDRDYAALDEHRALVSKRLSEFASDARVFAKYQWVARYHNYFCEAYAPDQPLIAGVPALNATQVEEAYDRP